MGPRFARAGELTGTVVRFGSDPDRPALDLTAGRSRKSYDLHGCFASVSAPMRTIHPTSRRGCDTVTMAYVLGSQVESMAFTDAGAEYGPAGTAHAVDSESDTYLPDSVFGYAVCGAAVRVWPDRSFDPDGAGVHEQCGEIARRGSGVRAV
jgi:hypothetical protein